MNWWFYSEVSLTWQSELGISGQVTFSHLALHLITTDCAQYT